MLVSNSSKPTSIQSSSQPDLNLQSKLDNFVKKGMGKLIGNTPLLDISHLIKNNPKIKLFAKAEFMNPGGSVKDRTALNIIKNAIENGELTTEKILLDSTSGNTGIAYAMICSFLGIKLKICLPKNASNERRILLKTYGAELILTDPLEGSDGAHEVAQKIYDQNPELYYYANQYNNPSNTLAHYEGTGQEILTQTNYQVTHFVAGLGTTGTFGGTVKRLKEHSSKILGISFQPDSPFHGLEGLKHLKTSKVPEIYNPELVDDNLSVSTSEAYEMTKRLASTEGILVGISSGAAIVTALKLATNLNEGVIVTILSDRGERYLSENVWRNTN